MNPPALGEAHGANPPVFDSQIFLRILESLCRAHRVPFDAGLVRQQFPPPHDIAILFDAARALGFKAGLARIAPRRLGEVELPCLAFLRDGNRPMLVSRSDGERLVYVEAGSDR